MKTDFLSQSLSILIKTEDNTNVDNILENVSVSNKKTSPTFNELINQLIKKQILIKLNKNMTYISDGRIIRFSNLIKQLSCNSKDFENRLNLESLEKDIFMIIINFIEILGWKKDRFIFDIKREELNNWFEYNNKNMSKVEEMAKYLKIYHIFEYFKYRETVINTISIISNLSFRFCCI